MKILFLSQWFQPEPMFKGMPFVRELKKRGHEVEVITGFPNYPTGKLYPGYKLQLIKIERFEGVKIVRTFLYPSHDKNKIKRILNYLSFSISASLLGPFLLSKPDVIYVYHPPITIIIPALILKMIFSVPVVLDIQDMWPDTLKSTGMLCSEYILKLLDFFCRLSYKLVDKIVVLSPGFKKLLIKRGVKEKKIEVIYNWCEENSILNYSSNNKEEKLNNNNFYVVYAGNLGLAQALETILKAAKIIRGEAPNIKFLFIGTGTEEMKLKQLAKANKLDNVYFYPYVPPDKMGEFISKADIMLVHLKKDPLFEITIPSKTQAYMAYGKPILMCVSGDAADLVKNAKAGITAEPENESEIANAIQKLYYEKRDVLNGYGKVGKNYYMEYLSLNVGVTKFEKLFTELINK